uniref:Uncharacterized protein n=1 Tax=Anopheles arabiensis TaxID=7173 RepID=A0A182I9N0_ANOAR
MATISLKGSKTWPSILQRIDAKGRTATALSCRPTEGHETATGCGVATGTTSTTITSTTTSTTSTTTTTATPATTNGGAGIIANVTCNEHGCLSGQAAAKASTLRRHYYPEGSWGWVVLAVGTLQAILNHGVQLSGPLYLLPAGERFHQPAVNSCVYILDTLGSVNIAW